MAKQTGLGDNLYVGGYDLSGDTGSIQNISGGPAPLIVTAINKSANERIGGLRDGAIAFTTFFNVTAGQEHPVLSALPTSDVIVSYCRGTTLGNPSACMIGKQINYDGTRANDGMFTFGVQAMSNSYGIDWGRQLTAGKRTDTGATDGASIDDTTASSYGLQAYLQVFSFTGTDATVAIQESSDDAAADAYADVVGGTFTQVTAGPTTQRIQTARDLAVERYLRVVTTTVGGFTSMVFAVTVTRNRTTVNF